tara:strand:- start:39 stop:668 length:630 start_codon:yes stop_codon:yes gene_type:complete
MTVKLVGSSSGSVSLQAPASTTGGANIEFKLPVADGSANQLLKTDGSGNLGWATDQGGTFASYALLVDLRPAASANLGAFTSGAWRTRDINTELADPDSIVTLSANQFTLQAGSYLIRHTQVAYAVNRLAVRLRNITDSTDAGVAQAAYYNNGAGNMWSTTGVARVVISSAKTFELQGQVEVTKSSNGFGFTMITGEATTSIVEIYKEA